MKDVFLCHASEDKEAVVRPLASALQRSGISYWLDEAELMWGDSLTGKINEGLRDSKYAIVVLSQSFVNKKWPESELQAVLNMETAGGKVRVLPLLVGDTASVERILQRYPLVSDKLHIVWKGNPESIVGELKKKLKRSDPSVELKEPNEFAPPIPRIRKDFSDRERDRFLKDAFGTVKEYFQLALQSLNRQDEEVEPELMEVSQIKFGVVLYVKGELRNQCVIWLGSSFGTQQICYRQGKQLDLFQDNSMNDWLSVESNEYELFLKPSGFGWTEGEQKMDPVKGAEYLWRRFTQML